MRGPNHPPTPLYSKFTLHVYMLTRMGRVGAPKLTLSPGPGSPIYTTATVVCSVDQNAQITVSKLVLLIICTGKLPRGYARTMQVVWLHLGPWLGRAYRHFDAVVKWSNASSSLQNCTEDIVSKYMNLQAC